MNQHHPARDNFDDSFDDIEPLLGDLETRLLTLRIALHGLSHDPHVNPEEHARTLVEFVMYHVQPAFDDVHQKWAEAHELLFKERPPAGAKAS